MAVTLTSNDTGVPKRVLIERAFAKCGSAGYEFERTPEEVSGALDELDAMMYEHPFSLLGYVHADYASGLPEDLSGLPNDAVSAVVQALAERLAPELGATLSPEAKAAKARSLLLLASEYATIPTAARAPNTPRGAGNRGLYLSPFITDEAAT